MHIKLGEIIQFHVVTNKLTQQLDCQIRVAQNTFIADVNLCPGHNHRPSTPAMVHNGTALKCVKSSMCLFMAFRSRSKQKHIKSIIQKFPQP